MNIKVTRSSLTSTELFAAAEADALALMRNHVRAIDDREMVGKEPVLIW